MVPGPPVPARPLTADLNLAIDIGGTKLAAGLVDRRGDLVWSEQSSTPGLAEIGEDDDGREARGAGVRPRSDDGDRVWSVLTELVSRALGAAGTRRLAVCGVGCGGPMTPGGERVSPLNIPSWRGFPLRALLVELTGLPVFVNNDAKALALGEGWRGAGVGSADFLAMVVSTGVGGGIVLDGRLLDGRLGNAGHIGHVVVEPDGRDCACGGRGCLEAEASGTAIAAMTGRPAAEAAPAVVERTGTLVGRAVASVAALLDLDLAVVAGSVALGFGSPFFTAAQLELERRGRLEFLAGTRIVPGQLGASGPLVGAAAVGWRGLEAAMAGRG